MLSKQEAAEEEGDDDSVDSDLGDAVRATSSSSSSTRPPLQPRLRRIEFVWAAFLVN